MVIAAGALFGVLVALPGQAQIVANPMAPGGMRPTILFAPNGVPVAVITTPSAAGVSRNQYLQFDVSGRGVVINNSRGTVQSQLGGFIQGNPFLATGPARIIVNEVNSSNPSYVNGPVEIAGQRAEFILANPSGISVSGGTFINASGVTLTTGTPQYNSLGGLDSYVVRGGTISINGVGLDVSKTDYAAILARAVQVNAAIYATDLQVVAGANQVSADRSQISPVAGTGGAPAFALDVAALGGMYAGKITLVGTEAGLGVRNAGGVGASNGNLVVTSAGRLENTGTLEGTRVELVSAGDIDNRNGTIRQTSSVGLAISAPVLSNTNGGVIGVESLPAPAAGTGGGTSTADSAGPSTPTAGAGSSAGPGGAAASAPYVPTSPGIITAVGALLNDGGKIYAGGPITLNTPQINNAGGSLSVVSMAVTGPNFSNAQGTLNVSQGFSANVGAFDNAGGKLNAGSLSIATSGDLINVDGTLTSATDANLAVGGKIDNTRGTISAAGALTAEVTGATINSSGTLVSNQGLTLHTSALENTKGSIQSVQAGVQLVVVNALVNGAGGVIDAATDLGIQAGSLANSASLRGANDVDVAVSSGMSNDGSVTAGRHATIAAGSLQSRKTGVLGAGMQSDGKLGGIGDLRVTTTGVLVASGTNFAAGNATLQGASVDLSASKTSAERITIDAASLGNRGGQIIQTGTEAMRITVGGVLDNSNSGVIGTAGNADITAGSLLNSKKGVIAAVKGDLNVQTRGETNNDSGTLQAGGKTTLANGGLINSSGKVFGDSVAVDTGGNALDNSRQGTLAATTSVDVKSGLLNNDTGLIQSGGAMTIHMDGKALTNTNSADYTTKQGGIVSAGTLDLKTGAVDNAAGFIGSKGALTADTQAFTNTKAGMVLGQSTVAINVNGTKYDNSGGQTLAVGNLGVNAGRITNTGGLIRAAADTTLVAGALSNVDTKGKDQGIEGRNIALGATRLDNTDGAIRSDVDTTVTGSVGLDNTRGLITAKNALRIAGSNTLEIDNTEGTLAADKRLAISARTIGGKGTISSGQDLSLSLASNVVNDGELGAKGDFSYTTTGTLTNNGKLVAGKTLTVGGSHVTNNAGAEMSGADTVVQTGGTFTNRGLIDSSGSKFSVGNTKIDASTLDNLGTGRMYGDAVSIAVGALNNENGATIAARSTLDIGVGTLRNTEHALLFSAGDMAIGGGLDEKRQALKTGSGTLDNLSASIEALGKMRIAMGSINNLDNHFAVTRTSELAVDKHTIIPLGGVEAPIDQFVLDRGGRVWSRVMNGRVMTGKGWYERQYLIVTDTDQATAAPDPGRIVSGGDMTLVGKLRNRDSQIMAGGTSTLPPAQDIDNSPTKGEKIVTVGGGQIYAPPEKGNNVNREIPIPPQVTRTTFDLGTSCINDCSAVTPQGNKPQAAGSTAPGGSTVNGAGAPGARERAILEVPSAVGGSITLPGNISESGAVLAGASMTTVKHPIALVVRTSTPNVSVPSTSLFGVRRDAGSHYLIETDPRFANYRNWLSSDYLLNNLGQDPNNILKRLGDGFYEQKLIREQVAQLTGYRYLGGYGNDEDQYIALMNSGATFAKAYGLRPGIALSPAQMAQLTSDIVWLVEQTAMLPDGTTQQVLVPQVYVRVQPGDITGSGSLLSADRLIIEGPPESPNVGDLGNGGTIAGRTLVSIKADNINNLGGRISGGSVLLDAATDINNIGGTIDVHSALLLKAGRDVNVETTTQSQVGLLASKTNIDRLAGLYVSNPGGTLIVGAGNDVNVIGGILSNKGPASFTSVTAEKNINLGTVTESESRRSIFSSTTFRGDSSSTETGSTIEGNGMVLLDARGGDINARAATLDAGAGTLGLTAARDINIFQGETTQWMLDRSQAKEKRTFKTITTTISGDSESTTGIGSRLYGESIGLFAGRDINVLGSDIEARKNTTLKAGGDVNIVSSVDSASGSLERTRTTKGFLLPKLGGSSIDRKLSMEQRASVSSETERASNVTAGENLTVEAGNSANVYASHLSAGKDLKVTGQQVNVVSGTNVLSTEVSTKTSKKSIGTMGNFKRAGKGMNGKESVIDKVEQTTLAPATLSGKNVTLTATEGNITLGAARIRAEEAVALNAPKGAVNMNVVKTASEVSQSRGESDPMYQRTRDTGVHVEEGNYTQIDAPKLKIDATEVNVQVGQRSVIVPGAQGQPPLNVPLQSVQQALQQVIDGNQPGMGWVEQLKTDGSLDGKINWQGVPVGQRQWAEKQGSLTPTGAAVLTVVVTVLTWGWGAELAGLSGASASGAALNAGLSTLVSHAAVSLVNNNGDVAATLRELGSSRTIKDIVAAMATAGAVQGLNIGLGIQNYTVANIGQTLADGTQVGWSQVLQRNLVNGVSAGIVNSAIHGTSIEEGIKNGLLSGLLTTAAAGGAKWIGQNGPDGNQNLNWFVAEAAHALAGCLVGAGRAASSGGGSLSSGDGCSAGALGALLGHLAGQAYNPNADSEYTERTIKLAQLVAGLGGALIGRTQAAADIASAAAGNAVENNWLSKPDRGLLNGLTEKCKVACSDADRARMKVLATKDEKSDALLAQCVGNSASFCQSLWGKYLTDMTTYDSTMHFPKDRDGYQSGNLVLPGYHDYTVKSVACTIGESGCTVNKVFEALKIYPAPPRFATPDRQDGIKTGDTSFALGVGEVTHWVGNYTITNTTIAGLHLLNPGVVIRSVEREGDSIVIVTRGYGDGLLPQVNSGAAAEWIWGKYTDGKIRDYLRK